MRGIHHAYLETDGMANFRACAEKCAVSDDTLIYRSCFWQPNEEAIMSKSTQINTAPTLRQFATYLAEGELVVTSKLGTSTVSRVKFRQLEYPAGVGEGEAFIRQRAGHWPAVDPAGLCRTAREACRCRATLWPAEGRSMQCNAHAAGRSSRWSCRGTRRCR